MAACAPPMAGQCIRYKVEVRGNDNALVDPAALDARVVGPDGLLNPTVEHPSVGVFYVQWTPPTAGSYTLQVHASGPDTLTEVTVSVARPRIPLPVSGWSGSGGGVVSGTPQSWAGSPGGAGVLTP